MKKLTKTDHYEMPTKTIQNPILRGFNPDPSICRAGEDYYIATSTFEWFPGVQIHHSRDLVNWRLIDRALKTRELLDMQGCPDSCGVWAPNLSFHDGLFYLVYSNVKRFDGRWKDLNNYLVTSPTPHGEWSEPIYLNSGGFDASIFHDDDGRTWILNMLVDHRNGKFFGGITLQEFCPAQKRLIGEIHLIFTGSELGITEGPNLYKRDGWYYLITAEGGTEYAHAVSMARSRSIFGPYEVHPSNPVITSKDAPQAMLQKSGHGSIVEGPDGEWYLTHLVGRPLTQRGRCTLGRETAIQPVEWREDGWLYLKGGGNTPLDSFEIESDAEPIVQPKELLYSFNSETLPLDFQTLRIPADESWLSLTHRKGYLALRGRESLCSTHLQSLVARRVDSFKAEAEVELEFAPTSFQQVAGLVCYYNTEHFHYLYVSYDENSGSTAINVISQDEKSFTDAFTAPLPLKGNSVRLRASIDGDKLQFSFSEGGEWQPIGDVLDYSILSDDYVCQKSYYNAAFTGSFVGVCCQDHSNQTEWAYFRNFKYLTK